MKDNFSNQSAAYSKYRPGYPQELFDFILQFVSIRNLAWDAGTGNGQTAAALARYFTKVFATDISRQQLNNAIIDHNILYAPEPAENTSLADASVNLITVSQALHWFNFNDFYAEVKRVAAPGAVIAVWSYSLLKIDASIDALLHQYHYKTLGNYWDAERKFVDDAYTTIPFPFKEIATPSFEIKMNWNLQELRGYLNTWSALQKFIAANGYSPVQALIEEMSKYWPAGQIKQISFPLHLKMGKVQ